MELIQIRICGRPKTIDVAYRFARHSGRWTGDKPDQRRLVPKSHNGNGLLLQAALAAWGGQREFTISPGDLLRVAKDHNIPLVLEVAHPTEEPIQSDAKVGYSDKLDADRQITAKEQIAQMIFYDDAVEVSEEDANRLGDDILYAILREFRPDLFDDYVTEGSNTTP